MCGFNSMSHCSLVSDPISFSPSTAGPQGADAVYSPHKDTKKGGTVTPGCDHPDSTSLHPPLRIPSLSPCVCLCLRVSLCVCRGVCMCCVFIHIHIHIYVCMCVYVCMYLWQVHRAADRRPHRPGLLPQLSPAACSPVMPHTVPCRTGLRPWSEATHHALLQIVRTAGTLLLSAAITALLGNGCLSCCLRTFVSTTLTTLVPIHVLRPTGCRNSNWRGHTTRHVNQMELRRRVPWRGHLKHCLHSPRAPF